jgi:hypothetical protein
MRSERWGAACAAALGTQFTCFTGTKVPILTQKAALDGSRVYVLGGCDAFSHPQVQFFCLFFFPSAGLFFLGGRGDCMRCGARRISRSLNSVIPGRY